MRYVIAECPVPTVLDQLQYIAREWFDVESNATLTTTLFSVVNCCAFPTLTPFRVMVPSMASVPVPPAPVTSTVNRNRIVYAYVNPVWMTTPPTVIGDPAFIDAPSVNRSNVNRAVVPDGVVIVPSHSSSNSDPDDASFAR